MHFGSGMPRCLVIFISNLNLSRSNYVFFQQAAPNEQNLWMENCLRLELDEQLKREEMLWKQKSRVTWLSSSDLNTKFFHASTIIRRCRNQILELKNGGGEWISGRNSIGRELMEFYSSLYNTDSPIIPLDLENL